MIGPERGAGAAGRVLPRHLDRLAIVYIRQSSTTQVDRNPESTRVQYGLAETATRLGWSSARVLIVDEDLGLSGASAEGRAGFQRILAEVALDHVGLVLGAEMSRLARSNKDFHQLLELCARFGTLIGDLDGLYDPTRYNDRLLLGLKGAMSEAELHILRQRLWQGKLQKAGRGELGRPVPTGYLRRPSGEVVLDPDEQVRAVVNTVFDQFDRIGSAHGVLRHLVTQGVQIGVRLRTGPDIGDLVWRRPQIGLITDLLKNPIYCGVYAYGRRQTDPRRKIPGRQGSGRTALVDPGDWLAEVPDCFPAYITRERYDANQIRLGENRSRFAARGVARDGSTLLQGLVKCVRCDLNMFVQYTVQRNGKAIGRYACGAKNNRYAEPRCQSLGAKEIDAEVSRLALEALAPAAIDISLQVGEAVEADRSRNDEMWRMRLERARYEASRAERQYRSVDPENRLVARTVERAWEEKLVIVQQLQEDYDRVRQAQPRILTEEERNLIRTLSADLPALWSAPGTSHADRKAILRLLIECVMVQVTNEEVSATIRWAGGHETPLKFVRGVGRLDNLRDYECLLARMAALRQEGFTGEQIADRMNADGWRTPTRRGLFNGRLVRIMMQRYGLLSVPRGPCRHDGLEEHEWPLRALADELGMSRVTLYGWVRRGVVRARSLPDRQGRNGGWIVFMDAKERERLTALLPPSARSSQQLSPQGVDRG